MLVWIHAWNGGGGDAVNLDPAFDIIREFESLKLNAYICPAGKPTIGWGTTRYPNGQAIQMGDVSQKFCKELSTLIKVPVTDNQFCALLSFIYNFGAKKLGGSTLLRLLNEGANPRMVALQFHSWILIDGVPSNGLIRRRKAEVKLFLKG